MGGALAPPIEHLVYIFAGSGLRGVGAFCRRGGPWGQGLKSLNFVHFQGPEHVKHEGFGLSGVENSMETKKHVKYFVFARRMTCSHGLATFFHP